MHDKSKSEAWKTQVFSDIVRDGLGVELLDEHGTVVAEVFRFDTDHSVSLSMFKEALPLSAIDVLLKVSARWLDPFEDGTPLATVWPGVSQAKLIDA